MKLVILIDHDGSVTITTEASGTIPVPPIKRRHGPEWIPLSRVVDAEALLEEARKDRWWKL